MSPLGHDATDVATLTEYGEASHRVRSICHRPVDAVPSPFPSQAHQLEPSPRVKIQEADAKSLLAAQGLPVPPWDVARTPAEARAAAQRAFATGAAKVVVKAQVLVGGRGKAGGVKLAD